MEERVKQNLINLGIMAGDTVGVAVSGGIDSMALLHCLCNLRSRMNITIIAYHMEHGIRAESSLSDMDFVVNECERLSVLCIVGRADVPALAKKEGISVETAARFARYAFLDMQEADFIATAHHMDDTAETVIMNLVRGSGLAGLCGIPEKRGKYLRPLLDITRSEIEEYAQKNAIVHVNDPTNDETSYTRNYIRKEIMPRIKAINEAAIANIARSAKLLAGDENALMNLAQNAECIEIVDEGVYIDLDKFMEREDAVKKRIIRLAISEVRGLEDVENVHVQSILELAGKAKSAKRLCIGHGVFAAVVYGKLLIGKNIEKWYNNYSTPLKIGSFCLGRMSFECTVYHGKPVYAEGVEYFDAQAVKGAQFRTRQEGDYILPLGLDGRKRLSDYLSDRKVPLHKRDDLALLARGSEIFWVVGVGVSESSKVKEGSDIFKVRFWDKEHD